MKNGKLPSNVTCLGYRLKIWAGLLYGLGTMINKLKQARDVLANLDYELLPILGIARTVKKCW